MKLSGMKLVGHGCTIGASVLANESKVHCLVSAVGKLVQACTFGSPARPRHTMATPHVSLWRLQWRSWWGWARVHRHLVGGTGVGLVHQCADNSNNDKGMDGRCSEATHLFGLSASDARTSGYF
jgi:hypothetical protein